MLLEQQRVEKEKIERAKRTSVAVVMGTDGRLDNIYPDASSKFVQDRYVGEQQLEEEEEEELWGLRGMESPPVLVDMDNRPSPFTRGDNGHVNLFRVPRDGNHGTEDFPHQKPKTKTAPETHPVLPESAYGFVPNPHGGGFGDLQGTVLNSSNRAHGQKASEEHVKSESANDEIDGQALYLERKGPDGCLRVYKIRTGTKENASMDKTPRTKKGSGHGSNFQSTEHSSGPGFYPYESSHSSESRSVAGLNRNAELREQNIIHLEDALPYQLVIDNKGRVHRIQLDSPKMQTGPQHNIIPHAQAFIPDHQKSVKPMKSKSKEVEIDNEAGSLLHMDRPKHCNASQSSFYHQKLMEKEMQKYDYLVQQRTKQNETSSKMTGGKSEETKVSGTKVIQTDQVDNHATINGLDVDDEHAQSDSFRRDDDIRYDVAHILVPEYYDDEPHPYELVRGADGNLHALQEKFTKTARVQDLKEVTTKTNLNYRYIQGNDGTIHRSTFGEDQKNSTSASNSHVLVVGLEDASDSEREDVFDDSKHTLRPRIGEWIEPESEAELQKTERLRANNMS